MIERARIRILVARVAALVTLCALVAYAAALGGEYVFDDYHSIVGNTALHDLGNIGRYWTDPSAFSGSTARMYRPALLTSFALNWAISPAAWSLRAGNVLLHATAAVLLFLWLWRLSRRLRAAGFVAMCFAMHPLASEAINLTSARSEVLAAVGMLVTLLTHLGWQRGGSVVRAIVGMGLGTVLACGSKETGAVLPAVCCVQALWLRHGGVALGGWRRLCTGLLPVVAVVLVYLVARKLLLGQATVTLLDRSGDNALAGHSRSLVTQLATMGTLLPGAALQMLAPFRLSFDPVVHYRASFAEPAVLAGWGTMLVTTWWLLRRGPSARLRRIGIAVAWLVALPWIVVPLNMPMAEHRLYAPMLGGAAVGVAALAWMRAALRRSAVRGAALPAVGTALLLLFGWLAADRSLLYRDERLLWQVELARHQDSFRSWWGLGAAAGRRGDNETAVAALARASELNPTDPEPLRFYAEALLRRPDAEAELDRVLAVTARLRELAPEDPWVRTLVAHAHLQAGRVRGAGEHFEQAEQAALSCLSIAPPKGYVYRLAATARRGRGDLAGALAHLDAAIARGLGITGVRVDRVQVLRELGRHGEARRELMLAQQQEPMHPELVALMQQAAAPGR
jgi:tetratricopeptide (TPR) repeat protein